MVEGKRSVACSFFIKKLKKDTIVVAKQGPNGNGKWINWIQKLV